MTAPEKAAPIPADVLERFFETLTPTPTEREKTIAALAAGYLAAALLADRASQEERIREDERLRFEGDLDGWMKTLGAGITGYQPEAYAVMDAACKELASSRGEVLRLVLLLMSIRDYGHGFVDTNVRDVINAGLDDHPTDRARLRGDAS